MLPPVPLLDDPPLPPVPLLDDPPLPPVPLLDEELPPLPPVPLLDDDELELVVPPWPPVPLNSKEPKSIVQLTVATATKGRASSATLLDDIPGRLTVMR